MAGEPYNEILYKAAEKTIAGSGGTAADPTVVGGGVASGAADSGNPNKIAVVYSAAAGLTGQDVGDRINAQGDQYGNVRSVQVGYRNTVAATGGATVILAMDTSNNGVGNAAPSAVAGFRWNGAALRPETLPSVSKRIVSSVASGNPDFLKASAGELVMFWGQNGAAITYLQVYNKASAPTIGTDTPILTYQIAANQPFSETIPGGGLYFSTGIAYAFTTDAAATTGAAAAAVTACNIIGA